MVFTGARPAGSSSSKSIHTARLRRMSEERMQRAKKDWTPCTGCGRLTGPMLPTCSSCLADERARAKYRSLREQANSPE
jgi:hypothetical protein